MMSKHWSSRTVSKANIEALISDTERRWQALQNKLATSWLFTNKDAQVIIEQEIFELEVILICLQEAFEQRAQERQPSHE